MNCACGAEVVLTNAPVTCDQCGRQNFSCPSCGGGISAAPEAVVLSCPYCDAPLQEDDVSDQPAYFPVNFTDREIQERLLRFLLNRFGIPGDFEKRWALKGCALVYVPVHLFSVTARLTDSIVETNTHAVIRSKRLWYHKALRSYPFAMRVKQRVDPDKVQGQVYAIELPDEKATQQAQRFGAQLLKKDKSRFSGVKETDGGITCTDAGQVFYPLYELDYRYGGRTYRCVVDAANGVVCAADHPMSLQKRAQVLVAGFGFIGFSVVASLGCFIGAIAGADAPLFAVGAGGGALTILFVGVVSGLRILWSGLRRHQSNEEIDGEDRVLKIPDLGAKIDASERKRLRVDDAQRARTSTAGRSASRPSEKV